VGDSTDSAFSLPPDILAPFAPAATESHFRPQNYPVTPPEGIVPVVGPVSCKSWLLAATQYGPTNIVLDGGMFSPLAVFNFWLEYLGVSPYFTFNGYLFKLSYTGYDAKTGKYEPGGKNVMSICTDGLVVGKDGPPYSVSRQPVKKHVGIPKGRLGGLGAMNAVDDFAFGPTVSSLARSRGVGGAPRGFGQVPFRSGDQGTPVMSIVSGSPPPVAASDWVEFYPSDPDRFQVNTNLGPQANLHGQLESITSLVGASAPGATTYWMISDPNSYAAWTVSTLTGSSGAPCATSSSGQCGAVALLRASYPGGSLKLEIALKTQPVPLALASGVQVFRALANGQVQVPAHSPSYALYSVAGPEGDVASSVGQAPSMGPDHQSEMLANYQEFIQQPQFLWGIPMPGQPWSGYAPLAVPNSAPYAWFVYGNDLYRVGWDGTWPSNGQFGSAVGAPELKVVKRGDWYWQDLGPALPATPPSPVVSVPGSPPVTPPTPPPAVTGISPVAGAVTGTIAPPVTPTAVTLPGGSSVVAAAGPQAATPPITSFPGTGVTAPASAAPSGPSAGALIVGGVVVLGIIGAIVYYFVED
jgi:hypothetical protein